MENGGMRISPGKQHRPSEQKQTDHLTRLFMTKETSAKPVRSLRVSRPTKTLTFLQVVESKICSHE
jgi:hypothetical protein